MLPGAHDGRENSCHSLSTAEQKTKPTLGLERVLFEQSWAYAPAFENAQWQK